MATIGDEVKTSEGEMYVMVSKADVSNTFSNATISTLAQLLDQVNINLNILIDTQRWSGKYTAIEEFLLPNVEATTYNFVFPVRYLKIYIDQPIGIQFNDIGNPIINVDATESPYVLTGMAPGFLIQKIIVTTGTLQTKIKILAMG